MNLTNYDRSYIRPGMAAPRSWTPAQCQLNQLLAECAEAYASDLRGTPHPAYPRDAIRQPHLLYQPGLGQDEAVAFLRAQRHGLVEIKRDSNFLIPNARACSKNLHLLSRNDDHFRVNTEALIHVGAYAELILDRGWKPSMLVFDPFFSGAALDLWGYAKPAETGSRLRDGRITFVAEAKARLHGRDSLSALSSAFERLQRDHSVVVEDGHRRKWQELVDIVSKNGTVKMLLAADGVRWWYEVRPNGTSVSLHRISEPFIGRLQ